MDIVSLVQAAEAAAAVVATDWTGMATFLTAIGALIVVIIGAVSNAISNWRTSDNVIETKAAALEAKEQSAENTKKLGVLETNTDGKLTELMKAVKGQERAEGKAEGKIEEKADQAGRDAAHGADIKVIEAKDVIKEAEEKAKKLREDAEIAAKKIVDEAHRISTTKGNGAPVPVKVTQDPADEPLEVTETVKRKPK